MKTDNSVLFVKRGTEKLLISMNKFLRKTVGGKRLKLINDRKDNSQLLET